MSTATDRRAPVLVGNGHVAVHYPTDARGNFRLTYRDADGARRELSGTRSAAIALQRAKDLDTQLSQARAAHGGQLLGDLVTLYVSTAHRRRRNRFGRLNGGDWSPLHLSGVRRHMAAAVQGVEGVPAWAIDAATVDHMRTACEDSFGFRGAVVLAAAVAVTTITVLLPTPWSVLIALAALIVGVLAAAPMLPAGVLRGPTWPTGRDLRPRSADRRLLRRQRRRHDPRPRPAALQRRQDRSAPARRRTRLGGHWRLHRTMARHCPAYRRRGALGIALLVVGLAAMWIAVAFRPSPALYIAAWTVAGVGMGMVYLDTINAVVEEPAVPDGISPVAAGSATVVVEQSATALAGTAVATAVAALLTSNAAPGIVAAPLLLLMAGALLITVALARASQQPPPAA